MTASPNKLGGVFDAHTAAEFKTRDIEATMATMAAKPHVTHVPTMTGGHGHDAVRRFYDTWFIGHWPEDLEVRQVSRTAGDAQVVDEVILSFTHDREMPALLPGIKPTGRKVVIPFVVVVGFQGDKNRFRAHLLGPGVAAAPGRGDRQGHVAGNRRRAGRAFARSGPAVEHADRQGLECSLNVLASHVHLR